MALTDKQRLFVKAYLANGCNATQAAISAGYSDKTATEQGSRLLTNVNVRAVVNRELAKAEANLEKKAALLGVTREKMIAELAKTAFSNIDEYAVITSRGVRFVPTDERPKGGGKIIKKITESTSLNGGSIGLEMEPRQPARELLCKMLGWTKEQIELTGKDGGPIRADIGKLTPEERKAELERLKALREEIGDD